MRTGTIVLMGALAAGLVVSWSPGQTPEDDARALEAQRRKAAEDEAKREGEPIAKDRAARVETVRRGPVAELERFLTESVPQARAVGVGIVLAAKVTPVALEGGGARVEFHKLEVSPATMLYGPRPKGEKVQIGRAHV